MHHHNDIKQHICDIGRRAYDRGLCAANEGNISVRLDENEILSTPTLICKGFMQPDDLCVVDLEGNQIGGYRKCTSEVRMHLAIYKARPDLGAVVHLHPPHATAFALAGEPIPSGIAPDVELLLGEVPTAPYALTGTWAMGDVVVPYLDRAKIMLMANHGTVSYDTDLEKAYWWTEMLDAYCRIVLNARQLGNVQRLTDEQLAELAEARKKWR